MLFVIGLSPQLVKSQAALTLVGEPLSNYGFVIWTGGDDAEYHRLTVYEVHWDMDDTLNVAIAERFEIWDKNYAKVPDRYLGFEENAKSFYFELQGFDQSHNPVGGSNGLVYGDLGDGKNGTKTCHWDCESSQYALRIQAYNMTFGENNYRVERAYEYENEELNVRIPYFQWFSPQEFNEHTTDIYLFPLAGNPGWHGYAGWSQFFGFISHTLAVSNLPHYQISQQNVDNPTFYNGLGHPIATSTVRGIRKGLGPWYDAGVLMMNGLNPNYCDGASSHNVHSLIGMFNQALNISPTLACTPLLQGSNGGGGLTPDVPIAPGGFNIAAHERKQAMKCPPGDPSPSCNGGSAETILQDEIIFIDEDNWMEIVAGVFAFDEPGTDEERFTQILATSQAFSLVKHEQEPEILVNGSQNTFFTPEGTPVFPVLDFGEGLYTLTIKREGFKVFFITFEVRHPFQSGFLLKDFFSATLFPNPHQTDYVDANIVATASLNVGYALYDGQANELCRLNFDVSEGHSGNHRLDGAVTLPNGFLYHKFTFDDGSYKTYTTIKQ